MTRKQKSKKQFDQRRKDYSLARKLKNENKITEEFEIFHLMNEEVFNCKQCESASIKRIPQLISKPIQKTTKAGEAVKQFIEDTKKDIREQKTEAKRGMDI